jgi:hypothetical protein
MTPDERQQGATTLTELTPARLTRNVLRYDLMGVNGRGSIPPECGSCGNEGAISLEASSCANAAHALRSIEASDGADSREGVQERAGLQIAPTRDGFKATAGIPGGSATKEELS